MQVVKSFALFATTLSIAFPVNAQAIQSAAVPPGSDSSQTPGTAVAPSAAAPAAEPVPSGWLTIPANTAVDFEIVGEISSKTAKIDEMFPIRLRSPIMVDNRIVVPVGTMGQGQVIHAAKASWGGRAGALILTARYLDFQGQHIPLRRFRMGESQTGESRVDEATVVTAIVPLAGFFMNGGEKTVLAGTHANGIVSVATNIPPIGATPAAPDATTAGK